MGMDTRKTCSGYVDTDDDTDCYELIEKKIVCMCQQCREKYL